MFNLFPISRFVISGNSMLPTLRPKTSVISFNWHYIFNKPKLNDLVVAKVNGRLIIKRIKRIDGRKIWVEGDNKKESTDSRNFGWIDKRQLIGKVIIVM